MDPKFYYLPRKIGLEVIDPSDTHGLVWKHDSVVVEVVEEIWIKAEKGGESWPLQNDGGIKLVEVHSRIHPKLWKDKGDVEPGRYIVRFEADIDLDDPSKLTVELLIQLLSAIAVDYRLFSANCWQYGNSSVKNVLNFVLEKSKDEAVKVAVRKKLEELKLVERPMPSDVLLALLDPSAPENIKILEKLRRKVGGTLEGLHPNATYRYWLCWSIKKFLDCIVPRNSLVIEDDGESASLSDTTKTKTMLLEFVQSTQYMSTCFPPASTPIDGCEASALTTPSVEPQRKGKLSPNRSLTATLERPNPQLGCSTQLRMKQAFSYC